MHARKEGKFGRINCIVRSAANYKEIDYLIAIAVKGSFYFGFLFFFCASILILILSRVTKCNVVFRVACLPNTIFGILKQILGNFFLG